LGVSVDVLPAAVDLQRFRPPLPGEKQRLRRAWQLPLEDRIALHVGHLVKARNLEVLASLAEASITPVLLASHVRDSESAGLVKYLRQAGVIVLDGYRPHVEELYRTADCYLFPSSGWGGGIDLPLSVLEAMATDLPIVATPFGALPERFAGADGLRFATGDGDIVQAVIEQIRAQPHTRHLVEADSWDSMADHLLASLGC
jgi:glycosyltransferase involved in cell wall biosynthesis